MDNSQVYLLVFRHQRTNASGSPRSSRNPPQKTPGIMIHPAYKYLSYVPDSIFNPSNNNRIQHGVLLVTAVIVFTSFFSLISCMWAESERTVTHGATCILVRWCMRRSALAWLGCLLRASRKDKYRAFLVIFWAQLERYLSTVKRVQ